MSTMELRPLHSNDAQALEVFKAAVWPVADKEHYGDQQPQFSRDELTLLATDGDAIAGYLTLIIDSGVAQIEPLMVAVDRKGHGIGTLLLEAAEAKAKELGVHKLWLETGADWKAKSFYEKHGFIVRAILPNHTGGREFVLMDKML